MFDGVVLYIDYVRLYFFVIILLVLERVMDDNIWDMFTNSVDRDWEELCCE